MLLCVEDERKIVISVILRRQIAVLARAVGCPAIARVINPADYVIEVRLLTNFRQVRRKVSAHVLAVLVNRVAGHAAARVEKLAAMLSIATLLLRHLPIKTLLPDIGRDCFNLICAVFITLKSPERRHLCAGTKRLRVLQP